MSGRASNFSREEDVLLCQVYIEISQDPIVGVYQSADRLWSRVEVAFNKDRLEHWEIRTKRSMQARIQIIERAAKKLHACIRAVESRHPSGASNEDIMQQAKILFMQDPKYKTGWKYDHVWDIIKKFEKFKDCRPSVRQSTVTCSSPVESETLNPNFGTKSSKGKSSISLDLNDEDDVFGDSSSQRPTGVKKAKLARKTNDDTSSYLKIVQEKNKVFLSELKKNSEQMNQHLEIQKMNYALKKKKEDDKILFRDLSSIQDPKLRELVQADQARIYRERTQQQDHLEQVAQQQDHPEDVDKQQDHPEHTNTFNQYYGDIGGSSSDLPPY